MFAASIADLVCNQATSTGTCCTPISRACVQEGTHSEEVPRCTGLRVSLFKAACLQVKNAGHGSATHTCGVDCTPRSVHVCRYQSSGTSTRVLVGGIFQDTLAQTYTDLTPVLLGSHKIHFSTVASTLAEAVGRARADNPRSAC